MLAFFLTFLATLLHGAMMVTIPPLLAGVLAKCRARLLGRPGPPVTQPYLDLAKRLRKLPEVPDNGSELYRVWPFVGCAATVAAALLTPGFSAGMATAPLGDVVTIIGLLALARAAAVLGGLETGFGLGGAGAGRVALSGILTDAALLVGLAVLAWSAQSVTLDGIGAGLRAGPAGLAVPLGLALLAILAVALADTGALTAGEAELGLARPALALEYSGRFMALWCYADMLRLTLWLSLLGSVFFPFGMARAVAVLTWPGGILLWLLKLLALTAVLAVFETLGPKPAVARVPAVLGGAMLLGLLAALFLFVGRGPPA